MIKKVSVITTLYNGNRYLSSLLEMINSNYNFIKKNNLNFQIEYIFVNDYPIHKISLDESEKQFQFPITVINNPENYGIHKSRAIGICNAKYEYVYILDQDDKISEDCIYELSNIIGDNDICVLNGYSQNIDGSRESLIKNNFHLNKIKQMNSYVYIHNQIISPGQVLIRKKSIPNEWINYTLRINCSDDLLLWILMLYYNKKIIINKDKYVYTHINTGVNLSLDSSKMYASDMEVLNYLKKYNIKINFNKMKDMILLNKLLRERKYFKIVLFGIFHPILFIKRVKYILKIH